MEFRLPRPVFIRTFPTLGFKGDGLLELLPILSSTITVGIFKDAVQFHEVIRNVLYYSLLYFLIIFVFNLILSILLLVIFIESLYPHVFNWFCVNQFIKALLLFLSPLAVDFVMGFGQYLFLRLYFLPFLLLLKKFFFNKSFVLINVFVAIFNNKFYNSRWLFVAKPIEVHSIYKISFVN